MKTRSTRSQRIAALKHGFLILSMLVMFYPIFMVIINSFKTESQLYASVLGLPPEWQFSNYLTAIRDGNLLHAMLVSIFITAVAVLLMTLLGSFAAFALTRRIGRVKKWLYWLFVGGIMIPYQVGLLQLYNIVYDMGLINSLWGLVLIYIAWGLPFTVYVMYGFFSTIPKEMEEAAKIDGCSTFGLYLHVVMPLSASVVSATVIYNLVWVWNDMLYPMIFIDSAARKPLSTALLAFKGQFLSRYTIMFAGVVIASLPIVIVYLLLQKRFVEGMMVGSLKG